MIIFSLQIATICFIINLVFAMDKWMVGLEILNTLNANGYEAYFVGGAVRDYLRKAAIQDIDITTNALPNQIAKLFCNVTMEGAEYYSCRIHIDTYTYEVTTFRKDISYVDHRHPMTIPVNSLEIDLARRDFTMNAIAMNKDLEIFDFFHGKKDIENQVIRCVGDPKVRFEEDGLRVLRALDFASRWNYKVDDAILKSFEEDYLSFLGEEYIIEMIQKIIQNPFDIGIQLIVEYQLFRSFPFYQVVIEEVYKTHYKKHIYALFYVCHQFLPTNLRISKKEIQFAKNMNFWIKNQFNSLALYYGDLNCLGEAIELNNILYKTNFNKEELLKEYRALPIKSAKDIHFSWEKYASKDRAKITKKLEMAILFHQVENEELALKKYLEIEG